MPNMNDVFAVILGGGRGTRLFPLTQVRSKPAVPIGGKYRLIDIPISNCINSGIYKIAVLTQFNSASLHRHIATAYNLNSLRGSVQILAASQTLGSEDWYQGTADAVRKQLLEIQGIGADYTIVLAGDHLYRMDYEAMAKFHWEHNADVTVAVQPVARSEAARLGILKSEADFRISNFIEKPVDPALQAQFVSRDDPDMPFLGSMGIYIFNTQALIDLLTQHPNHDDFGSDVIPNAIQTHAVYGYPFEGYWQDIGTIRSFYEANLSFTAPDAPFSFYSPKAPIYAAPLCLPNLIVENSRLKEAIIAEGCNIADAKIQRSIIGVRTQVASGVTIKDCVVMGADAYPSEKIHAAIPLGIGAHSSIEGAILDKNVHIGQWVLIRPFPRGVDMDCGNWYVRDGIVIIPKDAEIPDYTLIVPEAFALDKVLDLDKKNDDDTGSFKVAQIWENLARSKKVLEPVG